MRTVIDVPEEIIQSLDRVSSSQKKSRAAVIREALAEYLRAKSVPEASAAFGILKGESLEGVQFQEGLRGEWSER